jgi:LacI family transcriptional regulator
VLSGSNHPVSERTRERVRRAADVTGFHPNMLARALITNRSHTMAAIVHDISDPYFSEIVRGLEDSAHLHRYQLFISSSDRDPERELSYVRSFLAHRVDAIVFAGGGFADAGYRRELDALLTPFRDHHAVVRLSPYEDGEPFLAPDNHGGAEAMTRHLLELGHRTIGFIEGPPAFPPSLERLEGYRSALRAAGVRPDDMLVTTGSFTENGGARAAAALLRRRPDLTALFAANDQMALGALRELKRHDLDVPGDVSLGGFDDIRTASYLHPSLTTVRVPMYELGREGFFLALRMLAGEEPPVRRLPVGLQVRESTGPPRA